MGTYIVRVQCFRVYFAWRKSVSNSQQKRLSMSSIWVYKSGAQYCLWWTKKIPFFLNSAKELMFFKRRKNHFQMFLEVCIVQHAQNEKCFCLSTNTDSSFHDGKKCTINVLGTKNGQFCCLVVMVHILLQKRRVATTKKIYLHFWRITLPTTIKHTQSWVKKAKIIPFMAYLCRLRTSWFSWPKLPFHSHFLNFQSTR